MKKIKLTFLGMTFILSACKTDKVNENAGENQSVESAVTDDAVEVNEPTVNLVEILDSDLGSPESTRLSNSALNNLFHFSIGDKSQRDNPSADIDDYMKLSFIKASLYDKQKKNAETMFKDPFEQDNLFQKTGNTLTIQTQNEEVVLRDVDGYEELAEYKYFGSSKELQKYLIEVKGWGGPYYIFIDMITGEKSEPMRTYPMINTEMSRIVTAETDMEDTMIEYYSIDNGKLKSIAYANFEGWGIYDPFLGLDGNLYFKTYIVLSSPDDPNDYVKVEFLK